MGCGSGAEGDPITFGHAHQPFINGQDDRVEYFELTDERMRARLEQSVVALTGARLSGRIAAGDTSSIPTWGEAEELCAEERFADQPAAVFCSGVLVDWDLVLTSGHCTDMVPTSELRVIFDYYYRNEGELAASELSVYEVLEVITSEDDSTSSKGLDYAWLRLREVARPPHRPAGIYTNDSRIELGDPIINIGAGGGVPFKLDAGGRVQHTRARVADYFVADTDTMQGSSGSAAFDADLAVVGLLARGAQDFVDSGRGCRVSNRELDPSEAIEEFTYAHRAVQALCDTGAESVLCSPDCGQPCDAGAPNDGCALGPHHSSRTGALLGVFWMMALWRRHAKRPSRSP